MPRRATELRETWKGTWTRNEVRMLAGIAVAAGLLCAAVVAVVVHLLDG